MRIRLLAFVLAAGAAVAAAPLQTGGQAPATAPLTQTIPVDPKITTGQFTNGLKYYIRENQRPENRAALRLVVNVGSIVEDDDQLGLAHFVEHMAFNGTKNFPKQAIVSFMESIGMRFGPSVNAFTSFDETVYMLEVPTDKPEVLARSFQVLEDWAHNVSFDPAEIDKERGVVIEEWRMGRGASARMQDAQFPVLLKGSRYAERLPIGKKEILESFRHERLRQFYTDWYRPDLMAVVAVGAFDTPAVEALIKQHFGSIPAAKNPRPRPSYDVPDQPGTDYAIATDKEAPAASVSVYSKVPLRDPTTVGAYRQQIVESLFAGMLSLRFNEMAQKPGAPFLAAGAGRGLFVRTRQATFLNAAVKEDAIARGLEAMFVEAERVARFGFTPTEFSRQKQNMLRNLERAVAEKDRQESASLADEYTRNFTQREPIPGIEYENALYQRFVPAITLEEVNGLAREWAPDGNRVVLVSAPQKDGLAVPDAKALAAVIAAAAATPLQPYVDTVGSRSLLDSPPKGGSITRTATRPEFGITEWELSNGVKVVLRPTDFKQDEIVFRAFSPGGTSLASDADYVAASTAAQVMASGGLAAFSAVELQKVLTGKVASARPLIGALEEGLTGGGSPKDLETMFQLVYLAFTQPRADAALFSVIQTQLKAILANQESQPEFAYAVALQSTLSQDHPRARPMTAARVDEMSLEKSAAFYRDRFADASDFTFVFVGSFTLDQMQPLVERYLGALPSIGRKETWRDPGIRPPAGAIEKRVEKGIEPKSQTSMIFTGPFVWSQSNRVLARAMSMILETRLREVLREDLGGTYGVDVSASYAKIPRSEYSVSVEFGSAPERADALAKTVLDQIELFKAKGPTEQQVADVRETLLRDFEASMKQNGYLLTQIYLRYQTNDDLGEFFAIPDLYRGLTASAIQQAARTYFADNRVRVTLMPQPKAAGATLSAAALGRLIFAR